MNYKGFFFVLFCSITFSAELAKQGVSSETKSEVQDTMSLKSMDEYSAGDWSLTIGINQEATFGATYNVNVAFFNELIENEYWLETTFGAGFFREDIRQKVQKVRWYENDLYFNGDVMVAKSLAGFNKSLTSSLRPWVGLGFSAVYTGGNYQMGGVLGLGAMSWMKDSESLGWRLGVVDRIYIPDLTGDPGISHNFFLYTGVQWNL